MILHVSTVHHFSDTRIQKRMCNSSSKDFNVGLLCHDAEKVLDDGFEKYSLGTKPKKFFKRVFFKIPKALFIILKLKPKIVHLHDPELFFLTLILKSFGILSILDVHENYFETIKDKAYLSKPIRKLFSSFIGYYFKLCTASSNYIIVAWPKLSEVLKTNKALEIINNYPRSEDYLEQDIVKPVNRTFLFSGVISFERGLKEAVDLFNSYQKKNTEARLIVVGRFKSIYEKEYLYEMANGMPAIEIHEWMSQENLKVIMQNAHYGFIFFHDIPNHRHSIPNKLFEYIGTKTIPLTSSLPFLNSFISEYQIGVSADINDLDQYLSILQGIDEKHDLIYDKMNSLEGLFTWESEYEKLKGIYHKLLCI